jgi:hypothetical protein
MKLGTLVVAVLVVVAAFFAWRMHDDAEAPASPAASSDAAPRAASDPPRGTGEISTLPAAPGPVAAAPQRPIPYRTERYEMPAADAFARLTASTDPAAWANALEILGSCSWSADHLYDQTLRTIDADSKDEASKRMRRDVAALQRAHCSGVGKAQFDEYTRLRKRLAESGDPHAIAELGREMRPEDRDRVVGLAQDAAQTREPVAMNALGMFFVQRADSGVSTRWQLADGSTATSSELRDAFFLAACDVGEDCGPTNGMVQARCISAGWCDSTTLEDSLTRHHAEDVDVGRVAAARTTIRQGLASGQWPPGFWTGTSAR